MASERPLAARASRVVVSGRANSSSSDPVTVPAAQGRNLQLVAERAHRGQGGAQPVPAPPERVGHGHEPVAGATTAPG